MSNPAVSGTNYAVVNALLQAKGEEGGWSYFEGLNKNIAYYAKRGSDPKNKVTTDEYAIGITYIDGTIESLGWLAVALVIFATWRTVNAIWGSYLFGLLFWVYLIIPGLGRRDTYLFNMLPYLVTIAVLIFVSLRNKKENQPPASLGLAYFREER